MSKNKIRFFIVLAVLLVAFCVIALAVPFVKNAVFWLCFAFCVLAILIQFYAMPRAMEGNTRSKFYGFPMLRVCFIYLAAQLVAGFVFMALAPWAPLWLALLVFVLLLCAALIGFVSTDAVREEIAQQDKQIKKKVGIMRTLQSRASALAAQYETGEAGEALKKFAEDMRFSDPVSVEAIAGAEAALAVAIDSLQQAVTDGSEADIIALCRKATAALAERNRLCKLNKH